MQNLITYRNENFTQDQMTHTFSEIHFCYTGEPRSLSKGLQIRDKTLRLHINFDICITANYMIGIADNQSHKMTGRLIRASASLENEKYLSNLRFTKKPSENMYSYIIAQKLDILRHISFSLSQKDGIVIILTRPDWAFDYESLQLAARAINTNESEVRMYNSIPYKAICDQFMAIPQERIKDVIAALETGLNIAEAQARPTSQVSKDIMLGGDGHNRYGLGPEAILGVGFSKQLEVDDYEEIVFKYRYGPGTFDACRHNLIRDDAAKWMRLSLLDILFKKWIFLKGAIFGVHAKIMHTLRSD